VRPNRWVQYWRHLDWRDHSHHLVFWDHATVVITLSSSWLARANPHTAVGERTIVAPILWGVLRQRVGCRCLLRQRVCLRCFLRQSACGEAAERGDEDGETVVHGCDGPAASGLEASGGLYSADPDMMADFLLDWREELCVFGIISLSYMRVATYVHLCLGFPNVTATVRSSIRPILQSIPSLVDLGFRVIFVLATGSPHDKKKKPPIHPPRA
jgi:hypothetical protein